MKAFCVLLLFFFILQPLSLFGQNLDRFSLTGQIRHRTELDARDFNADEDDFWFHLLRTRLALGVDVAPDIEAFIQVQDARVFGSGDPNRRRGTQDGSAPALDFHQAFFQVSNFFDTPFSIKVGRQELAYGNQRIIGAPDWGNFGQTFDAGVLSYAANNNTVDLFVARLVESRTAGQNLYGLYATFPLTVSHTLEGFLIVDNNTEELAIGPDAGKPILNRFTLGTTGRGVFSELDYRLELMYQGGSIMTYPAEERNDIAAYLLSGTLGYTFGNNARLGILYTILSGDEYPVFDEWNAFNTLFGANHGFYGFMDFFPGRFSLSGFHNLAGTLSVSPSDRLTLRFDLHNFRLDQKLYFSKEKALGQEFDFTSIFRYNSQFSLQAGFSAFFPSEVMEIIEGDDTAFSLYLMSTITF